MVGKAPSHLSVLKAVFVTRVKRNTQLAMRRRAESSSTSLAADQIIDHRPAH